MKKNLNHEAQQSGYAPLASLSPLVGEGSKKAGCTLLNFVVKYIL